MADEREPAPWARSGLFPSSQEGASVAPAPEPKRRLVTVGGVLRWTGATVLLVTALGLFGAAGTITSIHEADLAERGAGVAVAQERITNAEKAEAALPVLAAAVRSLVRAGEDVKSVAAVQNTYLANSGPISLEGIPLDVMLPDGKIQVYTEEERTAMAQKIRDDAIKGLDRTLTQFFSATATDGSGMNAASDWSPEVEGLLDRDDVSGYRWVPLEVTGFDSSLKAVTGWLLKDADGALAGWATASYSFKDNRFSDLRIYTVAQGEEGAEPAPSGDSADAEGTKG